MANKNEVGRTLAKDLMHHHPGSGGGLNSHHHHHLSLLPNFLDTTGTSASTAAKEDMSSPTTDSSIGDVQQQHGPSKLQAPSGAADLLRAMSRYTTYFLAFWATQRDLLITLMQHRQFYRERRSIPWPPVILHIL